MSIKRICIVTSKEFTKSSNYININGVHPKVFDVINWDELVLKKEDLGEKKWFYVGNESEDKKEYQLSSMKQHEGWVPIIE